jgi:hypothetical protein
VQFVTPIFATWPDSRASWQCVHVESTSDLQKHSPCCQQRARAQVAGHADAQREAVRALVNARQRGELWEESCLDKLCEMSIWEETARGNAHA